MKITVINGFYDADKRRIIEKSETLDLDDKKASKLISLGLAAEVKEQPAEVKKPAAKPKKKQ